MLWRPDRAVVVGTGSTDLHNWSAGEDQRLLSTAVFREHDHRATSGFIVVRCQDKTRTNTEIMASRSLRVRVFQTICRDCCIVWWCPSDSSIQWLVWRMIYSHSSTRWRLL